MSTPLQEGEGKKILDACCGGRMFWFDKAHPKTLYIDIREEQDFQTGKGKDNRHRAIKPDRVMDFRKMDLPANSFNLVVFDPPHLKVGRKSYFAQIYGSLSDTDWREDLRAGFSECFRVLKENGVLIFKWNESDILLKDILALTPVKPLFGHRSGKAQKTHWVCFMKLKS
jgi:SAM-dependent methyltransferase